MPNWQQITFCSIKIEKTIRERHKVIDRRARACEALLHKTVSLIKNLILKYNDFILPYFC